MRSTRIPSVCVSVILLTVLALQPGTSLAANPGPAKTHAKKKQSTGTATVDQFIKLLLKQGHDYQLFNDHRAATFGFPPEGAASKAFQVSGDPTVSGKPAHMCNLVLDKMGNPMGIVLQIGMDFPERHKAKDWDFQLDLKGHLQRAVTGIGENDEAGNPVPGSAQDKDEDVTDPEIQDRADAELKEWLRYAHILLNQQAGPARHPAASASRPTTH